MSLLADYEARTAWKYEPIRGSFCTNEGLSRKVDRDGNYVPFPGSTVVFRPQLYCVQVIQLMQRILARKLAGTDMLASPLSASTIHMTLHDLISPEMCASDPADEARYGMEVADSLDKAADIAAEIQKRDGGRKITMEADRIVNMVSKSLVLMLRPKTEQDYELLCELYQRFEGVRSLPYPLTPHITLAYFRPGMLDGEKLGEAVDFAQINPENAPVFEFSLQSLTVQSFLDMQSYMDVPARVCFCCDGGMNRSVMASAILNHLAQMRKLPVTGEARSAFPDTAGRPVPEQVWSVLEKHGIRPDRACAAARYLEDHETAHFTEFAAISEGAAGRITRLGLPEERARDISRIFYGVRDPEYGEVTYEQAFAQLLDRAERFLDSFEAEYRRYVKRP